MAASDTSVLCTKIQRFNEDKNLRTFHLDVLEDYLSVSGYNNKEKATFVDVFRISDIDHGGQVTPLPEYSKPICSLELKPAHPDNRRTTCLLENAHLVTCSMNIIQTYNTDSHCVEKEIEFVGKPRCMAVNDSAVYIALSTSQVVMFDLNLQSENTIKLMGINFPNWPLDMAVYQKRLYICSNMGAVIRYNVDGGAEREYRPANVSYNVALSVTISKKHGLLYVLWGVGSYFGRVSSNSPKLVVVYSPNQGYFRAAFIVATDSRKIKICDKDDKLFVATSRTGQIYSYNVALSVPITTRILYLHQPGSILCLAMLWIINFDNALRSLELVLEKDDCRKLAHYFKIPPGRSVAFFNSDSASRNLLKYLRESSWLAEDDVITFTTACCHTGIIKSSEVLIHYQHFHYHRVKRQLEKGTDAKEDMA